MKVPIGGKGLTDNQRSHNSSVLLNQLAIRLRGKEELPQSRHRQRVEQPEHYRRYYGHHHCNSNVFFHNFFSRQMQERYDDINQLDADERSNHSTHSINQQILPQQRGSPHRAVPDSSKGQRDESDNDQRVENHRR